MPQFGQYLKAPANFVGSSAPVFNPNDTWIDDGTQFLFDFDRVACWPTQASPATGNTTANNLVTGNPNATIAKNDSGTVFREKGIFLPGVSGNSIQIGSSTDFELVTLGNPDVLYIIWIKRETGFSTGSYQNFLGRGTNTVAANLEFQVGTISGGVGISGSFSNGTIVSQATGTTMNNTFNALLDTTAQIALAFEGGIAKIFINGVLSVGFPVTMSKPFNDINLPIFIGAGLGGSVLKALIKRFGMTKLGYGKTAAERVLDDWNTNHTRLVAP